MTKRKTVSVSSIRDKVNACLASETSTPDGREAMCAFIENVLMEAGQYAGFRYIDPPETKPWEVEGKGTRRFYFA